MDLKRVARIEAEEGKIIRNGRERAGERRKGEKRKKEKRRRKDGQGRRCWCPRKKSTCRIDSRGAKT